MNSVGVGEAMMSPKRIVVFQIVLTLAAAIGIWSSLGAAIQAQSRIPRLTRSVMPQNPVGYFWPPVGVTLRVTVDERGTIAEVVSLGPARERLSFYTSTPMGGEVLAFTPLGGLFQTNPVTTPLSPPPWMPFGNGDTTRPPTAQSRSTSSSGLSHRRRLVCSRTV
jgi:hypothetical protein